MTRVKRGVIKVKKRERLLAHAKGFRWGRKSKARAAKEALLHAWTFQYRDRRRKKREFRRLWQIRINAAVKSHSLSYSHFAHLLKEHGVTLDRKILSQLAQTHPDVFAKVIERVKP